MKMTRLFLSAVLLLGLASPAFTQTVTFNDVAPIFQSKCQSCHEPGSIGPFSLASYKEARPWVRSIKNRVTTRQMPPWHIDQSVGVRKFKNDMSLTNEQIDLITKWVDGGAVEGDPTKFKAKPVSTDLYWQGERDGYGPPDLVITSPNYTMPAVSQDQWWRPVSDIPITEPRWIRMVEIRPSNIQGRKILHHSIAYHILSPENVDAANNPSVGRFGAGSIEELVNRRPQIMEWAIGKGYDRYMDGTGKLLMPGEKISWDEHIHAVGEEISTGSQIGFWFYPKGQEPKKRSYLVGFTSLKYGQAGLDIPPNSIAYSEGFTVLKENTLITSFQPHFHLRGKVMEVEAILPTGQVQTISYVKDFNFNWMTAYLFDESAIPAFPKGTIIKVSSWYDNTKANKSNPDPEQAVFYSDFTNGEMGHAWMNTVTLNDDEYKNYIKDHGVGVTNGIILPVTQQ